MKNILKSKLESKLLKLLVIPVLLLLVLLVLVVASPVVVALESSPYSFLRNSTTARSAGLSGAVVSLVNDPGILFVNPATISTVSNRDINITFFKHILDINSGNVSYVHHFEDVAKGTIAASVVYTNYGSFDYIDADGNATGGSFSGNLLALQGSYSNKIDENFYYGATVKLLYNSLEKMNGMAAAIDFGLLYLLSDDRTNFGFSVLNAGGEIKKIANESYSLPLDIRLGGSHRLRGLPLLFNFNFNHLNDATDGFFSRLENFAIGGELYFGEAVQVRLGFDNYVRKNVAAQENKGLSGFSAGVGIVPQEWVISFDYGLGVYTKDLFLHRFSLNIRI